MNNRRDAEKVLHAMSLTGQRNYFDAWKRVEAAICKRAKPSMKVFEVHHMVETARDKFYNGIIAGKTAIDLESEMS